MIQCPVGLHCMQVIGFLLIPALVLGQIALANAA